MDLSEENEPSEKIENREREDTNFTPLNFFNGFSDGIFLFFTEILR
jgi:hypothetical protein